MAITAATRAYARPVQPASQPTNANAAGPHTSATPNQVHFERVSHSTAHAIGMA